MTILDYLIKSLFAKYSFYKSALALNQVRLNFTPVNHPLTNNNFQHQNQMNQMFPGYGFYPPNMQHPFMNNYYRFNRGRFNPFGMFPGMPNPIGPQINNNTNFSNPNQPLKATQLPGKSQTTNPNDILNRDLKHFSSDEEKNKVITQLNEELQKLQQEQSELKAKLPKLEDRAQFISRIRPSYIPGVHSQEVIDQDFQQQAAVYKAKARLKQIEQRINKINQAIQEASSGSIVRPMSDYLKK